MIPWTFMGFELDDSLPPKALFGFIYRITYTDGTMYVGKKQLWNFNEKTALKSGCKRDGHLYFQDRIKKRKKVKMEGTQTESDWRTYEGSTEFASEKTIAAREILMFCEKQKELTYEEERHLFVLDVLRDPNYINRSIRNVYFRRDFE